MRSSDWCTQPICTSNTMRRRRHVCIQVWFSTWKKNDIFVFFDRAVGDLFQGKLCGLQSRLPRANVAIKSAETLIIGSGWLVRCLMPPQALSVSLFAGDDRRDPEQHTQQAPPTKRLLNLPPEWNRSLAWFTYRRIHLVDKCGLTCSWAGGWRSCPRQAINERALCAAAEVCALYL